MVATGKETRRVGRQRKHDPDFDTPSGQWSWWLRYNMPAAPKVADELAEACGVAKSGVFRWLSGDSLPNPKLWPAIAKFCGMKSWTELTPPVEFVKYLTKHRELPPDGKF